MENIKLILFLNSAGHPRRAAKNKRSHHLPYRINNKQYNKHYTAHSFKSAIQPRNLSLCYTMSMMTHFIPNCTVS